jgi:uncharacterized lipoprotein YbaY
MKTCFLLAGLLTAVAVAGPGCGGVQMDTKIDDPNANRVVTGTVEVGDGVVLPPDAVVAVRVEDVAHQGYKDQNAAMLGNPNAPQPVTMPPEVIGEQRIDHPQGPSIPFSVKFSATDQQMAGGLVLEARVSFGGKVRYFNVDSYAINSLNITSPRRIDVNGVR